MPLGVEHLQAPIRKYDPIRLNITLMPLGVEHTESKTEEYFDAVN